VHYVSTHLLYSLRVVLDLLDFLIQYVLLVDVLHFILPFLIILEVNTVMYLHDNLIENILLECCNLTLVLEVLGEGIYLVLHLLHLIILDL
jgi:hypothetical protein